jgi:hypothetical protein
MYVRSGFGSFGLGTPADTIASTIQQVEGYYPGTLAYKNNNPGNLIFVGQAGAVPGAGGFAAFPTYDAGYQALLRQIQLYGNQGLTIDQMMAKYAPAGQGNNNPTAYANTIASALGVSTDTTVADALAGSTVDPSTFIDASAAPSTSIDMSAIDPVTLGIGAALLGFVLYQVLA